MDSKNLKSLDIGLWEMGPKRPLNEEKKFDAKHTNIQTNQLIERISPEGDSLKIEDFTARSLSNKCLKQWLCFRRNPLPQFRKQGGKEKGDKETETEEKEEEEDEEEEGEGTDKDKVHYKMSLFGQLTRNQV